MTTAAQPKKHSKRALLAKPAGSLTGEELATLHTHARQTARITQRDPEQLTVAQILQPVQDELEAVSISGEA